MLSKGKKILLTIFLSIFLLTNLSVPFAHAQEQTWYNQDFWDWYHKVHDPNEPTEIFGERYTSAQVEWVMYGLTAFVLNQLIPSRLAYCIIEGEGVVTRIATCLGAPIGNMIQEAQSWQNMYRYIELRGCVTCEEYPPAPQGITTECIYNDQLECEAAHPGASYDFSSINLANSSQQTENASILQVIGTNPISSIAYFKDLKTRLKIVPEAKAQGFGFTAANPVMELWRMVRDITYFLLVIIVIAMAFMIMFRMKISPQTVISVQSALPKVVFALILITFSYAIAGFMIDLMYVVVGLLAGIIYNASFTSGENWGEIFSQLTGNWGVLDLMRIYIQFFFPAFMSALFRGGLGLGIVGLTLIVPLILTVIVGIMLIWMTIRILWILIKAYVNILIQIIMGPIQILLGTLTGGGFGNWLKTLLAELAVYPITGFLFFVSFIFLRSSFADNGLISLINWFQDNILGIPGVPDFPFGLDSAVLGGGRGWAPPLTIGSRAIELMWLAASLVTLTLIPKASEIAKSFILGGRFDMKSAIGESFAAVPWADRNLGVSRSLWGAAGMAASKFGYDDKSGDSKKGFQAGVARAITAAAERRGGIIRNKESNKFMRPGDLK
ncbi:hypothetical protein JXA63_04115 [Candidatus Woesebacteria bacterium]|nr:hypothetical protein [Candidatus Woesebacteria bacterium]